MFKLPIRSLFNSVNAPLIETKSPQDAELAAAGLKKRKNGALFVPAAGFAATEDLQFKAG